MFPDSLKDTDEFSQKNRYALMDYCNAFEGIKENLIRFAFLTATPSCLEYHEKEKTDQNVAKQQPQKNRIN